MGTGGNDLTARDGAKARVRLAVRDDAAAIATLHVDTWHRAYRGLVPQEYLDSLDREARRRRWEAALAAGASTTFVADDSGELLGFCSLMKARDEDAGEQVGEVVAIYVGASHWRRGVGGDLLLAAEREAARRGFSELTLWVLETNYPACAFYEKHGYWCDGSRKVETRGPGVSLPQVRYRK